ncbi:MAG: 5'/3'-nucleotidase SurE [Eubacteriales Family XIII. Incertae Sedis bacterium]|nr:MAG: 5'/3'-nucleotidase SurE [Clostridiales Family XIII bacterium]
MKILVANDDGINARGIHELVSALSRVAEVYVSAPHVQRSAAGHGMTLSGSLFVREVEFEGAEKAYEVSGTPADCVKIGLYLLKRQGVEIDMVFSGINHGGNLGTDTLYSGTVSAALEGNLKGYPAVAVSVDLAGRGGEPQYFEYAAELAVKFAEWGFSGTYGCAGIGENCGENERGFAKFGKNITLNINVPDLPAAAIKGVKTGVLAKRAYLDNYMDITESGSEGDGNSADRSIHKESDNDKEGKTEYSYGGNLIDQIGLPEICDAVIIAGGYAAVTPIHTDLTDFSILGDISIITEFIAN